MLSLNKFIFFCCIKTMEYEIKQDYNHGFYDNNVSVASVYELRNLFIKGSTGLAQQSSVEPVNKPPKRAVKFKKKRLF